MRKYSKEVIRLVDSAINGYAKYEKLEGQYSIDFDNIPDPTLHEIGVQLLKDDPDLIEVLLADIFGDRIEAYNQDMGKTNKHDDGAPRDNGREETLW